MKNLILIICLLVSVKSFSQCNNIDTVNNYYYNIIKSMPVQKQFIVIEYLYKTVTLWKISDSLSTEISNNFRKEYTDYNELFIKEIQLRTKRDIVFDSILAIHGELEKYINENK